jgi:hypothetical protein
LLNAQPFDPLKLSRYTVVRVQFYFPKDPGDSKLFVILNHVVGNNSFCNCLKITSNTDPYESTPEMLASCVLYQAGEVSFLPEKSVVQPDNWFPIGYAHFETCAKKHEFRIEGKMPDDFHNKLVAALKSPHLLKPKQAAEFLAAIDATPLAAKP